ncbi:MAG: InlB B-repeat-containing protein [Paludibacteraceae bacterium]|nr:InlB B-repeat-containing protein [Paludibacteraceae bacterium]
MKRFSIFFAALMMAASVQMAHATITYELNGGTHSTYMTAQDMYADLNADYNAATGATATWKPLADMAQGGDGAAGIPTSVSTFDLKVFNEEPYKAKWGWLLDYMIAKCTEQQQQADLANSAYNAFLRYNLSSFFLNGVRPGWPKSADYTTCGVATVEAYQPYWKSGFANPTEPTTEVTLNAPYKEGATFDGWYANADFSGNKVLTVNENYAGTLYAKWVVYIPTCAEVTALAGNTETQAKGIVTFINGKNVYIQDATGGMLLYMKDAPTFKVADEVVVAGKKTTYGGAPEVSGCTEVSATAATLPNAKVLLLSDIVAEPLKYFGQLVHFDGLKIAGYDDNGNAKVKDDNNEVPCYKMVLDQTAFPVGKKVNLTAIVGYYNALQLVGDIAGFEIVAAAPTDGQTYEDMKIMDLNGVEQTYSFKSDWMFSQVLGNFEANKPNAVAEGSRGMGVKDGIMYFPYRNNNIPTEPVKLVRVDAATGEMLDPVMLESKEGGLYQNGDYMFGVLTNIKFDNAGHMLTMNLPTSGGQFRVWYIDEKTGAVETIIDLSQNPDTIVDPATGDTALVGGMLKNIFPNAPVIRLDRLGVLGDIKGDAVIMSAVAATAEAYYWYIKDGKWDGESHQVVCAGGEGFNFGGATEIQPIEGDMFYIDGFATNPMLFDFDGILIDSFTGDAAGLAPIHNGHNGVFEFELNGEYFMACAYNNTVGSPSSSFCLYKCKDENRIFAEMTQMWVFPANGMGEKSNPQRCAVPFILADNANQKADVYVFTSENGYGKYTFSSTVAPVEDGISELKASEAGVQKLLENGNLVIIKNGVRYNAIGAAL